MRCEKDVRWLEVAMDDPAAVCVVDRPSNGFDELCGLARRFGFAAKMFVQRSTTDQLQNQIESRVVFEDLVNLNDIGMLQTGNGFGPSECSASGGAS